MSEKTQKINFHERNLSAKVDTEKLKGWIKKSALAGLSFGGGIMVADFLKSGKENLYPDIGYIGMPDVTQIPDSIEVKPLEAIVTHDVAPVAENISDELSFEEAFKNARNEVGPGGVFMWHGAAYNTYYKEEYEGMTENQRHNFNESIQQSSETHVIDESPVIHPVDVDTVQQNGNVEQIPSDSLHQSTHVSLESEQPVNIISTGHTGQEITASDISVLPEEHSFEPYQLLFEDDVDDGNGNQVHIGLVKIGDDVFCLADTDNNGSFDSLIGKIMVDEQNNFWLETAEGETYPFAEDPSNQEIQDETPFYEETPELLPDENNFDKIHAPHSGNTHIVYGSDYEDNSNEVLDDFSSNN